MSASDRIPQLLADIQRTCDELARLRTQLDDLTRDGRRAAWEAASAAAQKASLVVADKSRAPVRLTAGMVWGALRGARIDGISSTASLTFPQEITRDGPGWLALVDIPPGVIGTDVLGRRPEVASGLGFPVDQVWLSIRPATVAGPGLIALWVGDQPVSGGRRSLWPDDDLS